MSIHKRLLHAEEEFLLAVIEGSVESFDQRWTTLLQDVESAIHCSSLDSETISLAHMASSRIAILADSFHELYVVNQRLTTDLMDELDMITSQLAALDLKPHLPSSSPPQKFNAKHKVLSSPEQESSIVLQRYHRLPGSFDESSILQSSPTPSLVSLSTVDDSDEDIAPVPIIGRKRNASFMDDSEIGSAKCDRMVKRLRAASFEQKYVADSGCAENTLRPPSSGPFSACLFQDIHIVSSSVSVASEQEHDSTWLLPSRKRRLSDADGHPVYKRPRGHSAGPRLHTVSDPFPIGSSPEAAQMLDDWFKIEFGTPDVTPPPWEEVGSSPQLQVDFCNTWACNSAASVGRHTSQLTETVQQPILSLPFLTTMSSPSVEDSGSLPKTFTSPVAAPSSLSNLVEFPVFTQEVGCVSAHDFPDLSVVDAVPDSETKTIPPLTVESSPPSYQLNSPNVAATESTESDVISLYTTLYDADHTPGPLTSGDIHLPALDLSVTCPPSFSQSVDNEEDWIQFLSTLDQPPEVVLTTPPPPYDLSTDVARLLESLLEVANALPADFSPVSSDKQNKLKELEAAKEAVRRLEVEVGISV